MPELLMPAAERVVHRAVAPLNQARIDGHNGGTGDGSLVLTGYASVVDTLTTIYEGRTWVWRERIAAGAFTDVLARLRSGEATYPVVLNHEHDNRASIASTNRAAADVGGLELTEDAHGLRVFARLDPQDPDVVRLTPKMRNGVATQMSFAFTVDERQTLVEEDDQGRTVETDTIIRIRDLYDVTVCAHGAYPTTSADLRSLLAATGRSGFDPEGHPAPASRTDQVGEHGEPSAAPSRVGVGDTDRPRRLAAMRAHLVAASATHKPKELR